MNKLVELVKDKVGCGYVWGTQGEVLNKLYLDNLIIMFGKEHYVTNSFDAHKWIGKECFDCSGLIIWALRKLNFIIEDYTAYDIYKELCKSITKDELKEGDLVFKRIPDIGSITHVGVYIGDKKTIEAKGTNSGVVVGSVSDFNLFGRLVFDLEDRRLVDMLEGKGFIKTREYWDENLVAGKMVKADYVIVLLERMLGVEK